MASSDLDNKIKRCPECKAVLNKKVVTEKKKIYIYYICPNMDWISDIETKDKK